MRCVSRAGRRDRLWARMPLSGMPGLLMLGLGCLFMMFAELAVDSGSCKIVI